MNLTTLLNKPLEVSYDINSLGEDATLLDIGGDRYKIQFEKCPDHDDEDAFILTDEIPEFMENGKTCFRNIGDFQRGFKVYLKVKEETESETNDKKLEYNNDMQTTVKQLSKKIGVDVVYANGFIQTLVALDKAKVIGTVKRPAGTRGKPAKIYEIAEGIL